MSNIFRIDLLPAREGDCIWITYGDSDRPRHILIDGGRAATYADLIPQLERLPAEQRNVELLIITHVDRDHIEGVLNLIEDPALPVRFKDVWFNGYHHLKAGSIETFGAVQGERLTKTLASANWSWNAAFGGGRVVTPGSGTLRRVDLEGGLTVTILSPDEDKLTALVPRWERECERAGLVAGHESERPELEGFERFGRIDIGDLADKPFEPDRSEPNGSSIAVLAEFDSRRVLLGADAHEDRLVDAISPFAAAAGGQLRLDAFKVPHHGSQGNLSQKLLSLIECGKYLISTNGSYFDHPDPVAISRIIKYGGQKPKLVFNYRSDETAVWDNARWRDRWGYETIYPESDGFVSVAL